MNVFTLLEVKGAITRVMKPRSPNVAVEITRGCQITLEWDEMFGRYVVLLSQLKLEEQLCFAAKVNIMHILRLQDELNDTRVMYH